MNNYNLKTFYDNKPLREAFQSFLIEQLKTMAVDTVFDKKATAGIYEAKKVIDRAFEKLDELYGKIESPIIPNSR
jgi:hypothetical protein